MSVTLRKGWSQKTSRSADPYALCGSKGVHCPGCAVVPIGYRAPALLTARRGTGASWDGSLFEPSSPDSPSSLIISSSGWSCISILAWGAAAGQCASGVPVLLVLCLVAMMLVGRQSRLLLHEAKCQDDRVERWCDVPNNPGGQPVGLGCYLRFRRGGWSRNSIPLGAGSALDRVQKVVNINQTMDKDMLIARHKLFARS